MGYIRAMLAEVITIGDEILIGQVVDTNSAWLGQQLNQAGIALNRITSVPDTREGILEGLALAEARANLILITGGLGPTKDDITKPTLCEYFETELEENAEVLAHVEELFASRGYKMPPVNRKQAQLPAGCQVLTNPVGTAPGMWFEKGNKVFVAMPGVPYEMKGLMTDEVLPRVKKHFKTPEIYHKTVMTQGIGESSIMEIVTDWEESLPAEGLKLAYLPSPGSVRMRISGEGNEPEALQEKVHRKVEELKPLLEKYIFGYDDVTLQQVVGRLLSEHQMTVSTAESCTGGYIAHLLTSVAGSSAYFEGSIISYANAVKQSLLQVSESDLTKHGAVSLPVVEQMARGARTSLNTDFAVATSGIAGPGGGTATKPVGLVCIGIAGPNGVVSRELRFGKNRERNIRMFTLTALSLLRKEILKHLSRHTE